MNKPEITKGAPVRVLKWEGGYTGTVVRREGDDVFVAYHHLAMEDQLDVADVEILENPTPEQSAWRGAPHYEPPAEAQS